MDLWYLGHEQDLHSVGNPTEIFNSVLVDQLYYVFCISKQEKGLLSGVHHTAKSLHETLRIGVQGPIIRMCCQSDTPFKSCSHEMSTLPCFFHSRSSEESLDWKPQLSEFECISFHYNPAEKKYRYASAARKRQHTNVNEETVQFWGIIST